MSRLTTRRLLKDWGDWLDNRTGLRSVCNAALYEHIPGGARWRYVWGSTLVMAFVTQLVTGLVLWMAYSPSTQTAWESVYYIEYEMDGGWLLRGIHHFMAQAMVVLLALHFLQVVIDGAYRAPRELNFVIGILLMLIVLGLALTGYLLPWDQKGYWATNVGTELAGQAPVAGPLIKKLVVGGNDYGHHTLTRFFALHAGLLPGLLMLLLVVHIALFRRHGLCARDPNHGPDCAFWPDQVLRDAIASLAVLAVVIALTYWKGAELGAPADPSSPYSAARPEWYFLFLFQFLKWFPGELEKYGAFYIPGGIVLFMFLMPWIGRWKLGHRFNIVFTLTLLLGAGFLTWQAMRDDATEEFINARAMAHREAERAVELAKSANKIPATGALTLLQNDAKTQGPKLFIQHCASCHNYADPANRDAWDAIVNKEPTAPNLYGVGTREWVAGWLTLDKLKSVDRFGYPDSPFLDGEMATFVSGTLTSEQAATQREIADKVQHVAAALSAEAKLPRRQSQDGADTTMIATGLTVITDDFACTDCHKFESGKFQRIADDDYEMTAPDLSGYMSRDWLLAFIRNPAATQFYGERNDRMPAFAPHDNASLNQLDDHSLGLIVDWLRGDWYEEQPAVGSAE